MLRARERAREREREREREERERERERERADVSLTDLSGVNIRGYGPSNMVAHLPETVLRTADAGQNKELSPDLP